MASSARVYLVVLLTMALYAGTQILSKAAFNRGTDTFVFTFYRTAIGTVFLVPIALVLERKKVPPLSFKVSVKMFLQALCGMKTTGALLCFTGVIVLAFYTGPELKSINHHHYLHLYHTNPIHDHQTSNHSKLTWALGVLLMTLATTCWSLWQVWQGPLLKEFPSKLLNAALQSVFGTFQTFIIALILQRNFSNWKLGFDITLLAVIYTGIFVSALVQYLQIWVIEKRGPVFIAMNIPITLVITFAISWTFLGEVVHLGSIIGAALMVVGLYNVLWGKSRERKANQQQKKSLEEPLEPNEATTSSAVKRAKWHRNGGVSFPFRFSRGTPKSIPFPFRFTQNSYFRRNYTETK